MIGYLIKNPADMPFTETFIHISRKNIPILKNYFMKLRKPEKCLYSIAGIAGIALYRKSLISARNPNVSKISAMVLVGEPGRDYANSIMANTVSGHSPMTD